MSPTHVARSLLIWSLPSLLMTGCAFDDGAPWGLLTVDVHATAPATVRTAGGVTVDLETVTLNIGGVAFYGADDPAASFDPADAPDGCTLCHGGHCHCGDDLVPYAELAARAADGPSTPVLTLPAGPDPVAVRDGRAPVPLAGCTAGCPMPRGALTRAEFTLVGLRVVGRTTDGVRVDGWVPMDVSFSEAIDLRFDRDQPLEQALSLSFGVPASLFDGIMWPEEGTLDLAAAEVIIRDNVATDADWSAALSR